jgi:Cupin superfamily protein
VTAFLDIDREVFAAAFGRRSVAIRHRLVDHPLFTTDALAALADRLPADQVRRERGDLVLVNRGYEDSGIGLPSETVRTIAQNRSRVSLREIQSDAAYGPLIAACHAEVGPHIGDREGGVCRTSGYIFVSSPGSTTPMHFDPEHSFLLQVKGTKKVCSAPMADRRVSTRELERYLDGAPCSFDAMASDCDEFTLHPGDGLYLPSLVAHWVEQTGEGASVSFSIPFHTRACVRADHVHRVNKRLRRLHLKPRPPGEWDALDRAKSSLLRSWTRLRRADADVAG